MKFDIVSKQNILDRINKLAVFTDIQYAKSAVQRDILRNQYEECLAIYNALPFWKKWFNDKPYPYTYTTSYLDNFYMDASILRLREALEDSDVNVTYIDDETYKNLIDLEKRKDRHDQSYSAI